jgi:glycerol-3-phosphate O-acyltransferase
MIRWAKIRTFIRRTLDSFLLNNHDHFACQLPEKIGLLMDWVLGLVFSGLVVDRADSRAVAALSRKGVVVYATKYKSPFEWLFLHARLPEYGAPAPQVSMDQKIWLFQPVVRVLRILVSYFDHLYRYRRQPGPYSTDFFKNQFLSGSAGIVSMVDSKGFYRRYVKDSPDPLVHLLELQQKMDRPIYLIPQVLLYGTKPRKTHRSMTESVFGTEEKPTRLRRILSLFQLPSQAVLEIPQAVNLKSFLDREENKNRPVEHISHALRQEVVGIINRRFQAVTGPVLKTRQELKETVLASRHFRIFLENTARQSGAPLQDLRREADAYLEEIAAKYDTKMIAVLDKLVGYISHNMFDGVDVDQESLRRLKATAQQGPLVLVPCHKSHIDYLILSYVLLHNNMPCPLIAAGKNLSFWPLGTIFRNSGAFFMRRSFKGQELYAKVFAEYIRAIISEGFNIEFFIEGGRSRSGKLVMPKFGLLSMLLDAYMEGACKELSIVPIYIGYDRVIEESSYLHEIEGGDKESENISQVVKASRFLRKRFGRIFVRFDTPIRVGDVLNQFDVPMEKMTGEEKAILYRNIGHRVIGAIDKVTVVTPFALTSTVILTAFDRSFTLAEFCETQSFFLHHIQRANAEISDTLINPETATQSVLANFVASKILIHEGRGLEKKTPQPDPKTRYAIVSSKRPFLEYYKNNCISFLVPEAFTALSLLHLEAFVFTGEKLVEGYSFLQDLFKNEFHYDPECSPERYVRKALKGFIDDAMIMPHPTLPDTYNITAQGHRKLQILANITRPYLEAYKVVLALFSQTNAKDITPKELPKKARALGAKMLKKGDISRSEALSQVYFGNAAQYFMSRGIQTIEDREEMELYSEAVEQLLKKLG